MAILWRSVLVLGLLHIGLEADAQIYTCTGKDGTRVFSDEKCGPDAKVVPNITTTKKSPPKSTTPRPKVEPKSSAELETLLKQCNDGDMKACNTWTHGGGPSSLRDKERSAEKACEGGSLADCEYRYCNGAVSQECRAQVLRSAKVAGNDWYLRDAGKPLPDGSTRYEVRCVPEGARAVREVVVVCAGQAGPNRCASMGTSASFARLDLAAAQTCAAVK